MKDFSRLAHSTYVAGAGRDALEVWDDLPEPERVRWQKVSDAIVNACKAPGQRAYEAHCVAAPKMKHVPWDELSREVRMRWAHVAQAMKGAT